MRAIILAAGRGKRTNELGDRVPKCLFELHDKPLLDRQLYALRKAGVTDIALVTGYRKELLSDYSLVQFHNSCWERTNMVSSLCRAQEWLETGPCIVSYSDIFYEVSAVKSLLDNTDELAITYDPNWLELWTQRFKDPLLDAETFRLGSSNTVSEIGGKPLSINEVEGQYMGLLKFTPKGWKDIFSIFKQLSTIERDNITMTEILQKILDEKKMRIAAIPYLGQWGEVDSADDLALYAGWSEIHKPEA